MTLLNNRYAQRQSSRATRLLFAASLIAILAACTTLNPDYEPPTVTINSFRAMPSTGAVPNFEIGLQVVNPNREPLELQGVAYTITLAGRKLITGVGNDLPTIAGYSTGDFTVTASASLFQGFQLITDLMNTPTDTISYEVTTKLDVGTFVPAIRVRDTGELSLKSAAKN